MVRESPPIFADEPSTTLVFDTQQKLPPCLTVFGTSPLSKSFEKSRLHLLCAHRNFTEECQDQK
jgi:hypothetical protein